MLYTLEVETLCQDHFKTGQNMFLENTPQSLRKQYHRTYQALLNHEERDQERKEAIDKVVKEAYARTWRKTLRYRMVLFSVVAETRNPLLFCGA